MKKSLTDRRLIDAAEYAAYCELEKDVEIQRLRQRVDELERHSWKRERKSFVPRFVTYKLVEEAARYALEWFQEALDILF